MQRSKKAFLFAQKNGLIKTVNREIKSVYIEGDSVHNFIRIVLQLYPLKVFDSDDTLYFNSDQFLNFMKLFNNDNCIDPENWDSEDIQNCFIRLCYYMTPENEMHELADKEELVAIKHITDDDALFIYNY